MIIGELDLPDNTLHIRLVLTWHFDDFFLLPPIFGHCRRHLSHTHAENYFFHKKKYAFEFRNTGRILFYAEFYCGKFRIEEVTHAIAIQWIFGAEQIDEVKT